MPLQRRVNVQLEIKKGRLEGLYLLSIRMFTFTNLLGYIQQIWFSLGTKFHHRQFFLIFWTKFAPKIIFLIQNRKTEHHYQILQNRISLYAKFKKILRLLIYKMEQICSENFLRTCQWKRNRLMILDFSSKILISFEWQICYVMKC